MIDVAGPWGLVLLAIMGFYLYALRSFCHFPGSRSMATLWQTDQERNALQFADDW